MAEEEELAIREAEEEHAGLLALKGEQDAAARALDMELGEELKRTMEKKEENKKNNGELAKVKAHNKNLAEEVEKEQIDLAFTRFISTPTSCTPGSRCRCWRRACGGRAPWRRRPPRCPGPGSRGTRSRSTSAPPSGRAVTFLAAVNPIVNGKYS